MESQFYGHSFWVDTPADSDTDNLPICSSVFYGLMSRGAFEERKYDGALRYRYEVGEHGKSLLNGASMPHEASSAITLPKCSVSRIRSRRVSGLIAEESADELWAAMTRGLNEAAAEDLASELIREIDRDDY